jgi:hypothetical protein
MLRQSPKRKLANFTHKLMPFGWQTLPVLKINGTLRFRKDDVASCLARLSEQKAA